MGEGGRGRRRRGDETEGEGNEEFWGGRERAVVGGAGGVVPAGNELVRGGDAVVLSRVALW